jgi:hypothetical protein
MIYRKRQDRVAVDADEFVLRFPAVDCVMRDGRVLRAHVAIGHVLEPVRAGDVLTYYTVVSHAFCDMPAIDQGIAMVLTIGATVSCAPPRILKTPEAYVSAAAQWADPVDRATG